jgi:hypothetical protein
MLWKSRLPSGDGDVRLCKFPIRDGHFREPAYLTFPEFSGERCRFNVGSFGGAGRQSQLDGSRLCLPVDPPVCACEIW